MSALPSRRFLATAAAASSAALLVASCSSGKPAAQPAVSSTATSVATPSASSPNPAPSTSAAPTIPWAAGAPLISDGSTTVTIGGVAVTFPTKVTDAAWSPDGSRIAFVDGDGNIATARPDGTSLVAVVKPAKDSKLSSPAWEGGMLNYVEQTPDGLLTLRQFGTRPAGHYAEPTVGGVDGRLDTLKNTSAPSSSAAISINGTVSSVAFQYQGAKGPEIWLHVNDSSARGGADPANKIADGTWPALGKDIAFVGTNGQIDVVASGGKPVQLTTAAKSPTHLRWTPDGKSIAYSTPTGIESVPADKPGGATTQLSDKPGVISFLPAASDRVARLADGGSTDLVAASIAVAQDNWVTQTGPTAGIAGAGPTGPLARTVTLVPADAARAAESLGSADGYGPTLLIGGTGLDPRLATEIKRLLGTPVADAQNIDMFSDTVSIVGGPDVIPSSVDQAITRLGYHPKRVAATGGQKPKVDPTVAVVDKTDAAGIAGATAEKYRVITADAGKISPSDAAYLQGLIHTNLAPPIFSLDDTADKAAKAVLATTPLTVTRVYGTTPADFDAANAWRFDARTVTVIPTGSPTDLLLARLANDAIVTVDPAQGISATLKAYLDRQSAQISTVTVIDTTGKLSRDTVTQLGTLISGPLGFTTVANPTAG